MRGWRPAGGLAAIPPHLARNLAQLHDPISGTPAALPHGVTESPHDALFRFAFSRPAVAADELRLVLPPDIVARADWATLTPQPATFIDERLSRRECDLLFSVQLGGRTALL